MCILKLLILRLMKSCKLVKYAKVVECPILFGLVVEQAVQLQV